MRGLREVMLVWAQWLVGLVVAWTVAYRMAWAWVRGGLEQSAAHNGLPPACLRDSSLGRHRFFRLPDAKLHYVEAGNPDNPLLVLVHGVPDFWFTWRRQIPSLSLEYWVVAVDLRGCGDSDGPHSRPHHRPAALARDLAHLISALGLWVGREAAQLVCEGAGGQVGWTMCYLYPQLVTKLVLIHSPHPFVVRQHLHASYKNFLRARYVFFARVPLLPEVEAVAHDAALLDALLGPLLAANAITHDELAAYKFTFSSRKDWTGPLHLLRGLDLRPVGEGESSPGVITQPTLLIMGDADPRLPLDTAYRSAEYVERITVRPVSGQGRLIQVSHSGQVNQAIINFLRELPWRPLTPIDTGGPDTSSLMGRVMGASLAAVTKTTALLTTPRVSIKTVAQASLKAAESTLGLDNLY